MTKYAVRTTLIGETNFVVEAESVEEAKSKAVDCMNVFTVETWEVLPPDALGDDAVMELSPDIAAILE